MSQLKSFAIADLKKHDWQKNIPNICGKEWDEFFSDITDRGVQDPITVSLRTGRPTIVDGHQRMRAAQNLGLTHLEGIVKDFPSEHEEILHLASSARYRRHLNDAQRSAIGIALEEHWKRRAKENQGNRSDLLLNSAKSQKPVNTRKEVAREIGMKPDTFRKSKTIHNSDLEPVKQAWQQGDVSTHAAHAAVRAPDPIQEAISNYAVPVDDGLLVAKDKALSKDVAEGRKTVQEAVSVAKQMKEARQAEKKELDYDITHKVIDALEAITNLELSEYRRAAHSKETARYNVNAVEIGIEDAITHLQKAAEAIRILETPHDEKTITTTFN